MRAIDDGLLHWEELEAEKYQTCIQYREFGRLFVVREKMIADVGCSWKSLIAVMRARIWRTVIQTELTSSYQYQGVQREQRFRPILPIREEGLANEVLDMYLVQYNDF